MTAKLSDRETERQTERQTNSDFKGPSQYGGHVDQLKMLLEVFVDLKGKKRVETKKTKVFTFAR